MDGLGIPDTPQIVRAVIESFSESAHTVNVRPRRNPASLLKDVPLLAALSGEIPIVGDDVAVVLWGDKPGLCLGPYDRPVVPAVVTVWTTDTQFFTLAADTAYTYINLALAHRVTSHIMFQAVFNCRCEPVANRTVAYNAKVTIDGVAMNPTAYQGQQAAPCWHSHCLSGRSNGSYAPGTRTLRLAVYVYNAADSIRIQYCGITAWAVPA